MANNDPTGHASGNTWDTLHKFFTAGLALATMLLGFWQFIANNKLTAVKLDMEKNKTEFTQQLEKKQAALKQQVEKTTLVDQMLNRIEGYIEKQPTLSEEESIDKKKRGLTATDKMQILISLLKIKTEVHLQQTGQLEKDEQKDLVKAIPLYFALLSENDEMLVTIGSKLEDLALWVPLARATADPGVKETAARGLERIAALTTDNKVRAFIIESLLELTVDWQVPELINPIAKALGSVLTRIVEEDREDSPELAEAFKKANEKWDLFRVAQKTVPGTPGSSEKIIPKDVKPEIVEQVSQVFQEYQAPLQADPKIQKLIDRLESKDKNVRRSARSELGNAAEKAVPELLNILKTDRGKVYRIRLGVITAFLLMDQPVEIPADRIYLLTDLLKDKDSTIRKNTASFLIAYIESLGKRPPKDSTLSIESTIADLFRNLGDRNNKNGVYNSIVVLGEVKNKLPDNSPEMIKNQLKKTKEDLTNDPQDWRKTISLINRHIK